MGTIVCGRCGAQDDEARASFTEDGLVCGACAAAETARDAAQMQAQIDDAASGGKLGRARSGVEISVSTTSRAVAAPLVGAIATLTERGLVPDREIVLTSRDGVPSREGFRERWTLRSRAGVEAAFVAEGFKHKVVKLFKKELQAGDPMFDALVYVTTETPDTTAALLARPEVRDALGAIVAHDGQVSISGAVVQGELHWPSGSPTPPAPDLVARIALALAGR